MLPLSIYERCLDAKSYSLNFNRPKSTLATYCLKRHFCTMIAMACSICQVLEVFVQIPHLACRTTLLLRYVPNVDAVFKSLLTRIESYQVGRMLSVTNAALIGSYWHGGGENTCSSSISRVHQGNVAVAQNARSLRWAHQP